MANTDTRDNFKVVIKSRPLIKREREARQTSQWKIVGDTIEGSNPLCQQRYTFDHIYDERSTTQELYDDVARPIVEKSVKGFNGTIFAYGQTSSGKTYTMLGDKKNVGVIRLAARQIFNDIMSTTEQTGRTFIVKVNYLEIYNEKVYDLLNDRKEIKIQELPNGELKFGCTGQKVKCEDGLLKLVEAGNNHRKVAETNMNVQSSRSHAILQIGIESVLDCEGASQVSVLNLVDLAGSERADSTGATGERLKEAGNINKSLLTLSIVINKLSEDPDGHIGYRDSKLTRILQTSLGGNAMTVMICAITPAAVEETNLTLGFATRAKKIENKPVINETVSDAVEVKRAKKLIVRLEAQLAAQSKEIAEYRNKEENLTILKQMIIQVPQKISLGTNRRRTWAPNSNTTISPLGSISEEKEVTEKEKKPMCQLSFGDLGRLVECTDEEWGLMLDDTLGKQIVDIDENEIESTPSTFKYPKKKQNLNKGLNSTVRTPQARKSLLRTPTSVRDMLNRNNDTPTTSCASPIALDKENRIRMLEQELEELRHFQQTESMIHSSNADVMQAELEEKSNKITELNEQLKEAYQQMSDFEKKIESAQQEVKDAMKERGLAVKAKILAEQNMTSIEFEYEQHKSRATRREKELVEQLERVGNDEVLKLLKEKLANMTEKANSLETEMWQEAQKHNIEIENLIATISKEQEKLGHVTKQAEKLKNLQNEYDEVSSQLVDSIQENDQLKNQCKELKTSVETLNEKISELNIEISELKVQLSSASVNGELEVDLQEKNKALLLEIQELGEKHVKEIQAMKEQEASLLAKIQKLEKSIANHSIGIDKLEKNHRKETQSQLSLIQELQQDIAEQKDEILNIKIEHDDLLAYCNNLEHTNTLLGNACTQARMTVDLIMKETEILRKGYNDLKMSTAVQELEHLKLQRTISEYDDTNNFSVFNETVSNSVANNTQSICNNTQSICNNTQSDANNLQLIANCDKENSSALNDLTIQLQKSNEERDNYASRLDLILKCLTSIMQEKFSYKSVAESSENELLNELATNLNDLKEIKEKCNQLECDKINNAALISTLRSESQKLSEQLDLLQTEEKQSKDQLENEKSKNVQSNQLINELNQKLAEHEQREKLLNEQTEEWNEIKSKQRTEISRLQQIVAANANSGTELTKLNKELEEVNEKLIDALAQGESLKAEIESTKATLNSKELELEKQELNFAEKLKEVSVLENTLQTSKVELEILHQKLVEMKKAQEESDKQIKSVEESVTSKNSEIQDLQNEITSLKANLTDRAHCQTRLEEMAEQLEEKEKQLESANIKTDELKMNYENLQKETQTILIENQRKIDELEQKIALHQKFKDGNQKELEKMQQEFNEKLTEKDIQLKCLSDEISKLKDVASQKELLRKKIGETSAENERKINELEKLIALKIEIHERSEKEHREANNKIQCDFEGQLAQKHQEVKNASNKIVELENLIASQVSKDKLDKIQRDLTGELKNKEAQLKESQEILMKNDEKIAELQEIIDKFEVVVKESEENLEKNEEEISKLYATIYEQKRINTQHELKIRLKQKEKEMNKASSDIADLKEVVNNYERTKKDYQEKFSELQHRITVLEEEQECLEKLNKKLQYQIESHTEEMNGVRGQLTAMKQAKEKLEFEKQKMVLEMNAIQSKRHGTLAGAHSSDSSQMQSPRRRDNRDVDIDSLLNENRRLKSMQTQLENEVQELRKSTSTVRKIKRQSLHDDTRRISGFDSSMIDIGTQTDPVDDKCACSDMAKQITKLKQEIIIIESRFAEFRRSTGVDDLQAEIKDLKAELSTTKSKLSRVNIEYENLLDKHEKLKLKSVIAQQKISSMDAVVQTDVPRSGATFVDQMDWDKVSRRAEKYKKAYEDLANTYNQVTAKYDQLKKEYDDKLAKSIETAKLLDEIQPKYSNMKRICNTRWDQIQEFQQKIANFEKNEAEMKSQMDALKKQLVTLKETSEEVARYKRKYDAAKGICDSRKSEIERLRKLLSDSAKNNENIPVNK